MRKYVKLGALAVLAGTSFLPASAQTPSFDKEYYQKALWITTRFYGAQRSGVGPNWLIADYEPTQVASECKGNLGAFVKGQSFIKDADGSYDLTGGWYDCGDFATFGQTFFYSAYMLLLGYSEFPAGYDDYYSYDYHGYISAGDYTWEGKKGAPDGIPDILNEAKYATDFIMKAFRNNKTFYFQKGDGDADHAIWCTSPTKSTLSRSNGGEADGPRHFEVATGGETSMASLGGAALAAMARLYKKFDPEYAQKCLEKALVAYEYVTGTSKGNHNNCGFYGPKPRYETDEVIFYSELYRATGDSKYLKAAENASGWMLAKKDYNYNYSLCYNNTEDLACYLMASFGKETKFSENAMEAMEFYVGSMYKPASGYFLNVQNGTWGVLRFPANQAFVYGLYNKLKGDETLNPYSVATVDYLIGKNSRNYSFVVGLGDKFPVFPHHRNFYRVDNNSEANLPHLDASYKYVQLGYLVGGSLNPENYADDEKSYTSSEGGIDYNAGLVGALGYLNSMLSPVDVNKFGHPSPDLGDDVSICGLTSVELDSKMSGVGGLTFAWYKDGEKINGATSSTYKATSAGEYKCVADSAGEWSTEGTVKVLGTLPVVEVTSDFELCDPASYEVDLTMAAPVSYQWYKDGSAIDDATEASLLITKPGKYVCEASAMGCKSVEYKINVTSKLPEVADVTSTADGKVTMKVVSEGEYEWYDVPEGGTPLHTGATYSTTISDDKVFYVQDAGAMSTVVGPTDKSFRGTPLNWGDNISVLFKAEKALMITSLTVYLESIYNPGSPQTITVTLEHGGKKTTFTSDATNGAAAGFVKFNFSNPIVISEPGDYSLNCKPSNASIGFFATGPAYSSYEGQGNPITFLGATNGNASDNPFMGIIDWNITAGTGCARAMVMAKKGNSMDVENVIASSACRIYPNPVIDVVNVETSSELSSVVEVYNYASAVVSRAEFVGSTALDLTSLPAGVYVVKVFNNDMTYTAKLVRQ